MVMTLHDRTRAHNMRVNVNLRPGLYLVEGDAPTYYVIFWPEDATWETSDTTNAGKTRTAFMRFVFYKTNPTNIN